jgi:ComEC/Rec2-related protein
MAITQIFHDKLALCFCVVIVFILITFKLKPPSYFLSTIFGFLIGIITVVSDEHDISLPKGESIVIGSVVDNIRHPTGESVWFSLRIARVMIDNKFVTKRGIILCRAPFLPWRNSSLISPKKVIGAKIKKITSSSISLPNCEVKAMTVPLGNTSDTSYLTSFAQHLHDKVYRVIGRGETTELLLAMSLGVRNKISEKHGALFKNLGLSHLLVFSGLQLSLLFFSVAGLLRFLSIPAKTAQLVALIASALLLGLTGVESSGLRAFVALFLYLVADLYGLKIGWRTLLSIAALVVLTVWPKALATPGVQLTIVALVSLGVSSSVIKWSRITYIKKRIFAGIVASVICTISTGLLAASWFGAWTPVSLLVNPICTSVFTFLSIWLFFPSLVALALVPSLGVILLKFSSDILWWSVIILESIPSSALFSIVLPQIYWIIITLVVLAPQAWILISNRD